jgi:dihydroflavonol-4-reductase
VHSCEGHLVAQLLERGYEVVGTVRDARDESAVGYLRALPGAAERLTLVEADLLAPGSFAAAVAGCEGAFHTASPFTLRTDGDPETTLVAPAVQGTLNFYRAAAAAGTVRRIVTTSSFATIIFGWPLCVCFVSPLSVVLTTMTGHDHTTDPAPYTDAEWNTVSKLAPGDAHSNYRVSKVLAERAGWDFVATERPPFDLITLNPPMVVGPFLPGYRLWCLLCVRLCVLSLSFISNEPNKHFEQPRERELADHPLFSDGRKDGHPARRYGLR